MLKKLTVNKKSKAQGLVEFALILTLLLTLLYGIMETGRLMFIYASTVTAAREATRYGSATGTSPNGMPYYRDCVGIRAAAKKIGFLSRFADADILISYDHGPDLTCTINADCPSNLCNSGVCSIEAIPTEFATCNTGVTLKTGDRVKVCVSTTWSPIVGSLVPLRWGGTTNCSNVVTPNAITKSSERTILSSIAINVTAIPGIYSGTGGILLEVSSAILGPVIQPGKYDHVGQVIQFIYTMTNETTSDLKGAFGLISGVTFPTCGAGVILSPGISITCYGYHTVNQADLDAGSIVEKATAYTSGASSNEATTTIYAFQNRKLTIAIRATSDSAGTQVITTAPINTTIYYTYTVTNSGNVTLSSPVFTVTDNKLGSVTCPSPATLAPLGVITCTTKSYKITTADVNAGTFVNTATLSYPASTLPQTYQDANATATIYTSQLRLTVVPSATTATIAGQVIIYSYIIYNNSGATATTPTIALTDTLTGAPFTLFTVSCPSGSFSSGSSITCTTTYTVTQTAIDRGTELTHTATASANNGAVITSKAVNVSVGIEQKYGLALTISATTTNTTPITPPPGIPTVTAITDTFTFNYMLTNTGNTTLTAPYTISPSTIRGGATSLTITCGAGELAPAYINSAGVLIPSVPTTANFCSSTALNPTGGIGLGGDLGGAYGDYITNLATANAPTKVISGGIGSTTVSSSPVDTKPGLVATYNGARLALVVTATPFGSQIQYAYSLTNTGNVPVTLPSPYNITYKITAAADGTGPVLATAIFNCGAASLPIAINSSIPCANWSTYQVTTLAVASITNTATASATTTLPPLTNPTDIKGVATIAINLLCNLTHSGPVPNPTGLSAFWTIQNNTISKFHITSITVYWINRWDGVGRDLKQILLGGINVWAGTTNATGITVTSSTPSNPVSTTFWGIPPTPPGGLSASVNVGSTVMELLFNRAPHEIQVFVQFSEPACSSGLDSNNATQKDPTCTLPTTPTGTPTATKSTSGSNVNVTVAWTAVSGATSYNVYVSKNGSAYTFLQASATNSTVHNITSLATGTTLSYKINAVKACGESLLQSAATTPVITR